MAKLTLVANSGLCPGVKKDQIELYLGFVPVFAKKYGTDPTRITIPSGAGKWEGHVAKGTYRLDLQGTESGYANIQAQFGTGHENCSKGGSYGGLLMLCNTPFTVEEVQRALAMSLGTKGTSLVQMVLDDTPEAATPVADKRMKTKPGKKPWTPDIEY